MHVPALRLPFPHVHRRLSTLSPPCRYKIQPSAADYNYNPDNLEIEEHHDTSQGVLKAMDKISETLNKEVSRQSSTACLWLVAVSSREWLLGGCGALPATRNGVVTTMMLSRNQVSLLCTECGAPHPHGRFNTHLAWCLPHPCYVRHADRMEQTAKLVHRRPCMTARPPSGSAAD